MPDPIARNLIARYKASDGYTAGTRWSNIAHLLTGTAPNTAKDIVGSGPTGSANTAALWPTYRTILGKPSLWFDGADRLVLPAGVTSGTAITTQKFTIIVIVRMTANWSQLAAGQTATILGFLPVGTSGMAMRPYFLFGAYGIGTTNGEAAYVDGAGNFYTGQTNQMLYLSGTAAGIAARIGLKNATGTALVLNTPTTGEIGCNSGTTGAPATASEFYIGDIYEILIYDHDDTALTGPTQAAFALRDAAQLYAEGEYSVVGTGSPLEVWEGDSLTSGLGLTDDTRGMDYYAQQFLIRKRNAPKIHNVAVSSDTIANMITTAAGAPNVGQIDYLYSRHAEYTAGRTCRIWAGTNDLQLNNRTGLQVFTDLETFVTDRQTVGWTPMRILTTLDRLDFTPRQRREKDDYNRRIMRRWPTNTTAVKVVPVHLNRKLQNVSDTLYYQADGVHLTARGESEVARMEYGYQSAGSFASIF